MSKIIMTASNVALSEPKSNKRYLTLTMRMFSTQKNLNGVAVTEAFIDAIVANKDEYVCMPLCADTKKLREGDINGLGHMYEPRVGRFLAEMIGGFHNIEKVSDEYGVSLIGEARINKRDPKICEAICWLYENGKLNFSFEIEAEKVTVENETTIVDADDGNQLLSMAIVTTPAYPEAKALSLVAEVNPEEADKRNAIMGSAMITASDISLDSIYRWVENCMCEFIECEVFETWPHILLITDTYFVIYNFDRNEMLKFEYAIVDENILVTDVYKVNYVRAERNEVSMEYEDKKIESEIVQPEVAEVKDVESPVVEAEAEIEAAKKRCGEDDVKEKKPEDQVDEDPVEDPEDEPNDKKKELDMAELAAKDDQIAELVKQVNDLNTKLAELATIKAELDRVKAEQLKAEQDEKRSELKQYASFVGLDSTDKVIAEAIENLEYDVLVAEAIKNHNMAHDTSAKVKLVDDISVKIDSFGGLLDRG